MDINKNLAPFREFIKQNYKYALIYANKVSEFAGDSFRGDAFRIKSDLAHDVNKDEVLYIPVNLGRVITRIFTDYVIALGYNVDYNNEELNEAFVNISDQIELQLKLNEGANNQSSIGYWLLRLRGIPNPNTGKLDPRVEVIPLPNYMANMEGLSIGDDFRDIKEHYIFSVLEDKDGKTYFYVDRYVKQDNGTWIGYYGEKRANNGSFILSERLEEWEEEILNDLPLYLLNNDLDNPHIVTGDLSNVKILKNKNGIGIIPRFFHQSDYVDLGDVLQEINDRGSQISVEFIKNLTSKISVPAGFRDAQTIQALKNKNGDNYAKNPDYLVHNPGEEPARYITKDATYVQTSINDYLPYLLKLLWFLASIPAGLLANAIYGANNPVGTTQQERKPFIKRVEAKQQRMYSSLQRLFKGIMEVAGYKNVPLPTIKFNKPDNYDIGERTNTAIAQINAGIMSKQSAIAYIMGYDATEVAEEMDKIAEEEKNAYSKYDTTKVEFEDENVDEDKKVDDDLDENLDGDDAKK